MSKYIGLSIAVALASGFAAPALAGVTVGQADSGNCYPYSCGPTDGVSHYQEVYNGAAFGGALTIGSASFTSQTGAGPSDSASYDVSFYLTSATVTSLSSDLGSNEGTLLANWGTFTIGSMPAVLTLSGSSFVYDPSAGNLLMDVVIHDATSVAGFYQGYYNADYTGVDVARAWNSSNFGDFGATTGALVTTFGGAVPEPASWALMLGGFGLVGAAMRRRKAAVSVA